jgi:hypothetical protein
MTILITFFANQEVNCTEPSHLVRLPALMDRWTDRQTETGLVNSFIEREKIILLLSKTDVYRLRERG